MSLQIPKPTIKITLLVLLAVILVGATFGIVNAHHSSKEVIPVAQTQDILPQRAARF